MCSRGCPEKCTFCTTPQMWGTKVRWRNIDNIIDEIEDGIKNYNIGEIQFEDDTLTANKKRLIEVQKILENLKRHNNESYLEKYCEVLIENKLNDKSKFFGRTKYTTPVIFESDKCKPGELVNVKISHFNQNNLFGFYKKNKIKAA